MRWLFLLRCWWRGYHLFGRHKEVGKLSCRTCNKIVDQVSADGKFRIVYWPVKWARGQSSKPSILVDMRLCTCAHAREAGIKEMVRQGWRKILGRISAPG